jgi:hypothetical protein
MSSMKKYKYTEVVALGSGFSRDEFPELRTPEALQTAKTIVRIAKMAKMKVKYPQTGMPQNGFKQKVRSLPVNSNYIF